MLEVRGLVRSFGTGEGVVDVLKDISFSLAQGETAAILGRSGSGKSTLLSLLAGLDRSDRGSIALHGEIVTGKDQTELAKLRANQISIVFQQFHLLPHLTAQENVALALEISKRAAGTYSLKGIKDEAAKTLNEVGLGERLTHFPSMLSGGEQQRVALARSLVTRPKLLLADEPSGSLDDETAAVVIDMLFDLVQKHAITFILVTHDTELANRCQKTFLLEHGLLREQIRTSPAVSTRR
jgi:putative ABC transport system ATP-binding protein